MISDFSDKPKTDSFYQAIDEYVMNLGDVKRVPFAGQLRRQPEVPLDVGLRENQGRHAVLQCDPGPAGGEQEYPQGHSS